MTPVQPDDLRPSDGRTAVPRHRPDRHRWSQAVGPPAHGGVDEVRVGWLVIQLLVVGFLAHAFQFGYLTLDLGILSP